MSMIGILEKGTEFIKTDKVSVCGSAEINSLRALLLLLYELIHQN